MHRSGTSEIHAASCVKAVAGREFPVPGTRNSTRWGARSRGFSNSLIFTMVAEARYINFRRRRALRRVA